MGTGPGMGTHSRILAIGGKSNAQSEVVDVDDHDDPGAIYLAHMGMRRLG